MKHQSRRDSTHDKPAPGAHIHAATDPAVADSPVFQYAHMCFENFPNEVHIGLRVHSFLVVVDLLMLGGIRMDVNVLRYPVICFNDDVFLVERDQESLTTTNIGAISAGWYDQMLIVDSLGQAYRIRNARRQGWAGFVWPDLVRLRISFEANEEPASLSVDEVREQLYKSTTGWRLLTKRGDFEELETQIQQAHSVAELIYLLTERGLDKP
jgi:hypothetical protein